MDPKITGTSHSYSKEDVFDKVDVSKKELKAKDREISSFFRGKIQEFAANLEPSADPLDPDELEILKLKQEVENINSEKELSNSEKEVNELEKSENNNKIDVFQDKKLDVSIEKIDTANKELDSLDQEAASRLKSNTTQNVIDETTLEEQLQAQKEKTHEKTQEIAKARIFDHARAAENEKGIDLLKQTSLRSEPEFQVFNKNSDLSDIQNLQKIVKDAADILKSIQNGSAYTVSDEGDFTNVNEDNFDQVPKDFSRYFVHFESGEVRAGAGAAEILRKKHAESKDIFLPREDGTQLKVNLDDLEEMNDEELQNLKEALQEYALTLSLKQAPEQPKAKERSERKEAPQHERPIKHPRTSSTSPPEQKIATPQSVAGLQEAINKKLNREQELRIEREKARIEREIDKVRSQIDAWIKKQQYLQVDYNERLVLNEQDREELKKLLLNIAPLRNALQDLLDEVSSPRDLKSLSSLKNTLNSLEKSLNLPPK